MEIESISEIREYRDIIRTLIKKFPVKSYIDKKYGTEDEYNSKGLLSGIEAILIDISTLTKSPLQFIRISNYSERNNISELLSQISNFLQTEDLSNVVESLDQLKPIIRNYGVRFTEDRNSEFMENIDELQKKSSIFSRNLEEIKLILTSSEEIKNEIEKKKSELEEKINELNNQTIALEELLEKTDENNTKMEEFVENASIKLESISEDASNAKSHKEVIENFSKRVEKRENQLEKQELKTEEYHDKINEYENSHNDILERSKALIESAKVALNYKTAEGLSIAFIEKYNELKNDKSTFGWISIAGIFFGAAVGIGIWILADKNITLEVIIGRISLIPLLIGGSWFCASQYLKHKNLAEDYAYKSVLVKSIVGFSEQLATDEKRNEEYKYYLKAVLDEIHNDPTLKNKPKAKKNDDLKEDIKLILKETKSLQTFIKQMQNFKSGVFQGSCRFFC